MPWQRDAADVILELDPSTGHYWHSIFVITVQRQAGKTKLESDIADHRCLTTRRGRVWVTMQNGKTVDSWMRDEHMEDLAGASIFGVPDTSSCRYRKSLRAGEVGVRWLSTSSTFLTFPPKRDALHSKQSDLVLVDEAWAHDAQQGADLRQAIRPTMATRRGAQLGIVSTLGDDTSVYLDGYIERARAQLGNPDARVCLVDYGIPDDADPEDLDVIAEHHPAYGYTVSMESLRAAKDDFDSVVHANGMRGDPAGWARAYGNRATKSRALAFPPGSWARAARGRRAVPDRAGIALDVTPAGDRAAIVASWRDESGQGWSDVLYAGAADRSTVDLLSQLARVRRVPIDVDRASFGSLELTDALGIKAPDVDVRFLNSGEYASACGMHYRQLLDDTAHHFSDPDLDAAAAIATKRPFGDGGWGWGRRGSSGSIAELVAASISLRAFDTLPAPVSRPRIITASR